MLAENLKALRKAKGLSQEELAARLHVVRQTVSKWEKGRSVPDADLLIRLAEELDTTSAALLGPEVPPEAERGGTAEQLARIAEPSWRRRCARPARCWNSSTPRCCVTGSSSCGGRSDLRKEQGCMAYSNRRESGVQAFWRRQNLEPGRIHF